MTKNYMDKTAALYMATKTKTELAKKVTKEEGKGLSTNDFTDALKTKLEGVSGSGTHIGGTAPEDTGLLWVDTANGGILKYYNGSAWIEISSTPNYSYGTTDLTAGTSSLDTGKLYFVYE